ncbi:MAG: hypothetical protein ACRD1Z_07990 [Vicinamibacteria bacterium]
MIRAKPEYARAAAAAVVADLAYAPSIKRALIEGRLDRRGLANVIFRDLGARDGSKLFPRLRKFFAETARPEVAERAASGMGQWAELATAIIPAIASAASSAYGAKTTAETQKKLAELELQKQTLAIKTAELQSKVAQAQYSMAESAAVRAEAKATAEGAPSVLGVPWWGVALGVAGVGTIGYLLLRPKSRTRR